MEEELASLLGEALQAERHLEDGLGQRRARHP